jgi:hypothetical protein
VPKSSSFAKHLIFNHISATINGLDESFFERTIFFIATALFGCGIVFISANISRGAVVGALCLTDCIGLLAIGAIVAHRQNAPTDVGGFCELRHDLFVPQKYHEPRDTSTESE